MGLSSFGSLGHRQSRAGLSISEFSESTAKNQEGRLRNVMFRDGISGNLLDIIDQEPIKDGIRYGIGLGGIS